MCLYKDTFLSLPRPPPDLRLHCTGTPPPGPPSSGHETSLYRGTCLSSPSRHECSLYKDPQPRTLMGMKPHCIGPLRSPDMILTVQGPLPVLVPLLMTPGSHRLRHSETCSLEDLTVQPPPPPLLLASGGSTEARTVSKRVIRILLECFLVL